jgi:EAL domain-containing protein (putative c-di-GMP-specific phosphodiesterase class I)
MAESHAGRNADRGVRTAIHDPDEAVRWLLSLARDHLQMDLSWLSRFTPGIEVIEALEGDAESFGLGPGSTRNYAASYCARVLDGRLPNVIPNVREDDRAAALPLTDELGIGAYVGAPVVLDDGRVYGMLCCLSHHADPQLSDRDGRFLSLLAEVLARFVSRLTCEREDRDLLVRRIGRVIDEGGPTMVFQPVVAIPTLRTVGAEALARFPSGSGGPEWWFTAAATVGLRTELELAAIRAALAAVADLPDRLWLAVNASPTTVASERIPDLLTEVPADRAVIEVTEHDRIEDYPATRAALDNLHRRGARTAVDDVGVGQAGLDQLLQLAPDIIKMDRRLTRKIDADRSRRALAGALVQFAREIGAYVLAEGVETAAELDVLAEIGINHAQGFHLGHPRPLPLRAGGLPAADQMFPARSRG